MQVVQVRRVTLNAERAEVWIVDAQGNQVGVTIPTDAVIELTEEAEEFDDENDRWLKMFSTPIESGPDGV